MHQQAWHTRHKYRRNPIPTLLSLESSLRLLCLLWTSKKFSSISSSSRSIFVIAYPMVCKLLFPNSMVVLWWTVVNKKSVILFKNFDSPDGKLCKNGFIGSEQRIKFKKIDQKFRNTGRQTQKLFDWWRMANESRVCALNIYFFVFVCFVLFLFLFLFLLSKCTCTVILLSPSSKSFMRPMVHNSV